jgi:hypothetical protein
MVDDLEPKLKIVGESADAVWQVAKEIQPDMQDLAQRLKELASDLHGVRMQMRKRQEILVKEREERER